MQLEFPWLKEQDAALGTTTMEAAVEESCGGLAGGGNAGPVWLGLGRVGYGCCCWAAVFAAGRLDLVLEEAGPASGGAGAAVSARFKGEDAWADTWRPSAVRRCRGGRKEALC
jgi:hypothetical protein